MKQELLTKARRYQKRGFLSENYRGYYWKYCDENFVSPQEFQALVKGDNVYPITKVRPQQTFKEWWSGYKDNIYG